MINPEDFKKNVEEVSQIVRDAALFLKQPIKKLKGDANPSTNVDKLISKFLTKSLKKIIDTDVLSEEEASEFSKPNSYFWLIDPIDGTINFISGSPDIAISVALVDREFNAVLAVVYLPHYDEMFTAIEKNGAFLNGKSLNKKTNPKLNIVAYGQASDASKHATKIAKVLDNLIKKKYVLRQSGSATIDICRVAKGTWKAFFEEGLFIWDTAAANLIVQESGRLTFTSTPDRNFKCDYIASEQKQAFYDINNLIAHN